jgi:hypothetical protein
MLHARKIWPSEDLAVCTHCQGLATRKPMLLFSFVGLLLLRSEEARLFELLLNDPPRKPRDEPER